MTDVYGTLVAHRKNGVIRRLNMDLTREMGIRIRSVYILMCVLLKVETQLV